MTSTSDTQSSAAASSVAGPHPSYERLEAWLQKTSKVNKWDGEEPLAVADILVEMVGAGALTKPMTIAVNSAVSRVGRYLGIIKKVPLPDGKNDYLFAVWEETLTYLEEQKEGARQEGKDDAAPNAQPKRRTRPPTRPNAGNGWGDSGTPGDAKSHVARIGQLRAVTQNAMIGFTPAGGLACLISYSMFSIGYFMEFAFLCVVSAMSTKNGLIDALKQLPNFPLPRSCTQGEGKILNFKYFAGCGHLLMCIPSDELPLFLKDLVLAYQEKMGGSENIIDFGVKGKIKGRSVREGLLRDLAAMDFEGVELSKLAEILLSCDEGDGDSGYDIAEEVVTANFEDWVPYAAEDEE